MTRAEMVAELLEVLNDSTTLGAWTAATLLGYLAEGQDMFCEDTGYFRDNTTLSITLVSGTAAYSIPDRVIEIIDIWDGTRKLGMVPQGSKVSYADWDFDIGRDLAGTPGWWQADQATGTITLSPTPADADDGDTYTVQAWRYSLEDLAADGAEPEIPSQFHRACIEWAAYKAFMHHDMETQDPVKAADHLRAYREYAKRGKRFLRQYQRQDTRIGFDQSYRT